MCRRTFEEVADLPRGVLPFFYRALEDLVDRLAMTDGLQVSGGGVTAEFAEHGDRDVRAIGRELDRVRAATSS